MINDFKEIPINFIANHLSKGQQELLILKYKIFYEYSNNPKIRSVDIARKYFLSNARANEIVREIKNNKRLR